MIELKRLLGMRASAPLQLRDSLEQLVMREAALPLKPDATAVAVRADVQEAEARIRVADAQIDRAQREGRFDLSLFGSYMRMDAGFPQLGLNAQGEFTRVRGLFHYLSVGAALTVPWRNTKPGRGRLGGGGASGGDRAAQCGTDDRRGRDCRRDGSR